jgi:DNA-binding winged helix-turn-helix (wHTH) protein
MAERFTIGDWSLDVEANTLTGEGRVVRLEPKGVDVCTCLARRAGENAWSRSLPNASKRPRRVTGT